MRRRTKIGLLIIVIALCALIYIDFTTHILSDRWRIFFMNSSESVRVQWQQPTSAPVVYLEETQKSYIDIPIREFIRNHVVLFIYPMNEKILRFFVIKEGIGEKTTYRAVADACELCFTKRQGFDYKDSYFICRDCSMEFHSQRVGVASGGCNPIPIPLRYEQGSLQISRDSLAKIARMF